MIRTLGAACALLLITAAIALPQTADAAVVVYSGYDVGATGPGNKPNADAARAAFASAIAGLADTYTFTFEGLPQRVVTTLDMAGHGALSSAQPERNATLVRTAPNCAFSICGGNTTTGGRSYLAVNSDTITFTFDAPIAAFGAFITGAQFPGLALTFDDGSAQSVGVPGFQGADFVGFTDFGRRITSITFNTGTDVLAMDDITFALAPPEIPGVPEPAIWALMIGGFGLAGARLRARRRRLAA